MVRPSRPLLRVADVDRNARNRLQATRPLICILARLRIGHFDTRVSHWHNTRSIGRSRGRQKTGTISSGGRGIRRRRITKGCTRSTHSGGCEVVRFSFVPGEPRRYPDGTRADARSFLIEPKRHWLVSCRRRNRAHSSSFETDVMFSGWF